MGVLVRLVVAIVIMGVLTPILGIRELIERLVLVLCLDGLSLRLVVAELRVGRELEAKGLLLHEGDVQGLEHELPVELLCVTLHIFEGGSVDALRVAIRILV